MKRSEIIILIIILISFALGIYLYPQMPANMASHWGTSGEVNGYMPKFWGLFLMPLVALAMFLLCLLIPRIDPHKENIVKFRPYFDNFILLIIAFLFYIYCLTLFWNLGVQFSMNQFLPPAIGILFYYAGVLISKAKMNWFIGIRTPWTLSNEKVWDATHKIGGKLFKISGIIAILSIFIPRWSFFFVIIPVLLFAVYIVFYSYFKYKKETGR